MLPLSKSNAARLDKILPFIDYLLHRTIFSMPSLQLVEAGEWTRENADAAIQQYYDLLGKVDNGLLVSKRESDTDDQYFVSYPETAHTEGFQNLKKDSMCFHRHSLMLMHLHPA